MSQPRNIFISLFLLPLVLISCNNPLEKDGDLRGGLIQVIPSEMLNGWDYGFLLDEKITYCLKENQGDIIATIGLVNNDSQEAIGIQMDSLFNIKQIVIDDDYYQVDYATDHITITGYNRKTEEIITNTYPLPETSILSTKSVYGEIATEVLSQSVIAVSFTTEMHRSDALNAFLDVMKEEGMELVMKGGEALVEKYGIAAVFPGLLPAITAFEVIKTLIDLGKEVKWIIETKYFGYAEANILSTSRDCINVNITKYTTIPAGEANHMKCGIVVNYMGRTWTSGSGNYKTQIYEKVTSTEGGVVVFNINRLTFGKYSIIPFLSNGDYTRYGKGVSLDIYDIDRGGSYSMSNKNLSSRGPGKIALKTIIQYVPLPEEWSFLAQGISFETPRHTDQFVIGNKYYEETKSIDKTINISDLVVDYSSFQVQYILCPTFFYFYDLETPIKRMEFPLSSDSFTYEKRPTLTLTGVDMHTDSRTEKKKKTRATRDMAASNSDSDEKTITVYTTKVRIHYQIDGVFWMEKITTHTNGNVDISGFSDIRLEYDGSSTIEGILEYDSENPNPNVVIWFSGTLINGQSFSIPTNGVQLTGSPEICMYSYRSI